MEKKKGNFLKEIPLFYMTRPVRQVEFCTTDEKRFASGESNVFR
jgi:hypothetical protein